MKLTVNTSMGDYDITIQRGAINSLSEYCNTNKKATTKGLLFFMQKSVFSTKKPHFFPESGVILGGEEEWYGTKNRNDKWQGRRW